MIFNYQYPNIDSWQRDLSPSEVELLQKEELESLEQIYRDEIKILTSSFPFKLQIVVFPFLETQQLIYPPDYRQVYVQLLIELTSQYPLKYPLIKFFSPFKEVNQQQWFRDFEQIYQFNKINLSRCFIIQEIIERIRQKLYEWTKTTYKNYKKIRHFMDEEILDSEEFYMEVKWDDVQNLTKKENYTAFSLDAFEHWKRNFLIEMKNNDWFNSDKNKFKDKMTGKEIFINQDEIFNNEEPNDQDNEEEIDIQKELQEVQKNQQGLQIQEDLYQDEEIDDNEFK